MKAKRQKAKGGSWMSAYIELTMQHYREICEVHQALNFTYLFLLIPHMDKIVSNTQDSNVMFKMITNKGENVGEISMSSPVLLVFLRHFGCAFCRAAMLELSKKRKKYEKLGIRLVFVHLSPPEEGDKYFERFQLSNCEHVSDENCVYYASFGLVKGNFNQLFGLSSLLKGFSYTFKKGHGWGMFIGDGFQMPGVFLIQEGEIKESFIHKTVSDQPDYDKIVSCCIVN